MHLHVLKCCKSTLDMSPIIMGPLVMLMVAWTNFFEFYFFSIFIWYKMIFVTSLKNKYRSKNIPLNKFATYYRCNNGDIPGTRTVAHLLLQFFFLQKQKRLLYLSHFKWFKYNCDSYFFKNVRQYNAIHLYNVTMRNEHQFHMRNVVNTYIT